jgi:PAS domain S-box-containing protein
VIASATVVVFLFGVAMDLFARVDAWINAEHPRAVPALLGILFVSMVAAAVFAWLRWRQARLEQALRAETERRFQALIEQMPSVTYTWDPRASEAGTPTLYVSPQIEQLLGYAPQEWIEDPDLWKRILHPDDRVRVLAASRASDVDGTAFHEEYRCITRDGRTIWLRDDSVPVSLDAEGRPLRMQGVMFDITAQKEAETRLQEAEDRFRTIVERVPAVAYTWDAADRPGSAPAAYISPQIERLLGYRAEQWTQDPQLWARRLHPADLDRVLASWDRAVSIGSPFTEEYRIKALDGTWVWVRDEAVPVAAGARGRPLYQGVMFDITEQRKAQDGLREAEARFRTLVEQLPAITYIEEPTTGRDLYISPQIERVYGYTPGEWLADPGLWSQRLHPDDRGWVLESEKAAQDDRWSGEYRSIAKDGRVIWLHNEAVLIRDDRGEPLFWQGVAFDITERMEAEERLREAEVRYRNLVEQVPVAVYMDAVDELSTALYISPQYEGLTGYSPERRMNEPGLWASMLHPDDRERVLEESERTNATGDPFDVDYRIVRADGRVIWVHDHAFLVEGPGGIPAWQGVLTDVTERRLAEEALARRDRILEAAGFAAERFLRATVWTECIDEVLARLGPAGDAGRAFVFRNGRAEDGARVMTIAHEWRDPSGGRLDHGEDDTAFRYADGGFARWEELLAAGEVIHGPVRSFPESERRRLEPRGIRSCIVAPITVDGEWWGFIGFDHTGERDWQAAEIDALRVTANTLGGAIGRERAADRLSEAEARYRGLIETIPAATYIDTADALSQAIYMSPQVAQIYGYTPQEWKEHPEYWERGLHPDDHDRVTEAARRHIEDGSPYEVEYRFRHRDGRWIWCHDESVMILDEQGQPRFSQGVVFDITAQKQHEDQLRDAEERFRAIVEHVPSAIYLDRADESMESLYISPQIEQMTGVTPQEWLDVPDLWLAMAHPDDREEIRASYLQAATERQPWSAEYRMRTRDGRTIWVHDETTFLHDEDGNPTFMQGVISDVTERKLAEQALRESEQRERDAAERLRALDEMKNTFLAAVSHELRSPLTSILGLSLTLERTPGMEPMDREDLLGRLSSNARKLDRLLKDLLDIDRLNRGIVEPQYRTVDIGALARRTFESLESLADRNVVVEVENVLLTADPAKVERIVENLLMNAARHTTADRSIWLRVEPFEKGALIAVEDDGPGVPLEISEAIFEPFRQGPTASPHSPGTGIGLSLVARFAELHGGRAWVQEREGGGASFRVFVPDRGGAEPSAPVPRTTAVLGEAG